MPKNCTAARASPETTPTARKGSRTADDAAKSIAILNRWCQLRAAEPSSHTVNIERTMVVAAKVDSDAVFSWRHAPRTIRLVSERALLATGRCAGSPRLGFPPRGAAAWAATLTPILQIMARVFFDIAVGDAAPARLVMKLYADKLPRTVENFRALCTGEKGFGYKGSKFHRVIKGFMAQGGDFTRGDGTGGKSIYGRTFDDEGFPVKHTKRGQLSMANAGKNTNGSQFFLTFTPCPHLDGRHMVFGEVESDAGSQKLLDLIESLGNPRDGPPLKSIVVTDSGELK
jgi:cyclophilin family peptidyl-prolyl cis-trans isomerase